MPGARTMIKIMVINRLLRRPIIVSAIGALALASPAFGQELLTVSAGKLCAEAAEPMQEDTPDGHRTIARPMAIKLVRGLSNLTLGWAELPKQVTCVSRERGWLIGVTRGTFDGVGMSVARMLAGAYEIVTFPLPVPPKYQPMLKPNHVWQRESSNER